LSPGGLYEWFRNKEDVLDAVAMRHLVRVTAAIEESVEARKPATLEAFARAVLEPALDTHQTHPSLHRFLYGEAPRTAALSEMLKAFEERMETTLTGLLKAAGLDAQTARTRAALTARTGEAALHSFVLDDALPGTAVGRLDELIARLRRLALDDDPHEL
jgi:AcrR family transcriptional regulator